MKKYLSLALALALGACNNEEPSAIVNDDAVIRLSENVVLSRADANAESDVENIGNGEQVYAWMFSTGTPATEVYKAWKLMADGSGGLSSEKEKIIPEGMETLKAYALHANTAIEEETTSLPGKIIHTVFGNQSIESNYQKSDLLYSIKDEIKGGKTVDNKLTFYHMLSKIQVELIPGDGYTAEAFTEEDLRNAVVFALNTKPVAKVTIDQAMTEAGLMEQAVRQAMITAGGTPVNITLRKEAAPVYSAIVVPQQISGDLLFISINDLKVTYPLTDNMTLESGKQYTFKIEVNKSGLGDVKVEIGDWTTTVTVTGNATNSGLAPIRATLKEKDLLRGVIRGSGGSLKAYYIFNDDFTEITSYVINKEMQGDGADKQIEVNTQNITVPNVYSVTWKTEFAGVSGITLVAGNPTLSGTDIDGFVLDDNKGAAEKFNSAKSHYEVRITADTDQIVKGDVCKLFFNEAVAVLGDWQGYQNALELTHGANWSFTVYFDRNTAGITSYLNESPIIEGKDFITFKWTGQYIDGRNSNQTQHTGAIKNMFEAVYDTNILIPVEYPIVSDKPAFYMINKNGKGWFKFERQPEQ